MSYQKITICGIIGQTAEVKNFNGKDFITFSVGVPNGKDAQGNQRPTTWFEVSKDINMQTQGWMLERLVAKSLVLVEGRVSVNAYIDKSNQAQGRLRVRATTIEPLGVPQKNTPQSHSHTAAPFSAPTTNNSFADESMPF